MKAFSRRIVVVILGAVLFGSQPAWAESGWFTLETPHFLIHYQQSAEALAKRTAAIAEQVHDIVSGKLDWVPREKTHVVLSDSSDVANGFVLPFPYNRGVLFLSPPITEPATSLLDYGDSWTMLIMHEYTHVVHLDKGRGFIAGMRNVFGRVPLLFPNALNTPWILEGLGTHYETDDEAGTGRGQSSYFKMLMRGELAAGFKPVKQVNLPISSWPGNYSRYLYGVYFFRFLDSRYGEGASERFVENYSDNFVPWRIGGILKQETGKEIGDLWLEYRRWLEAELGSTQPAGAETRLTRHGNFTHGLGDNGNGELFYVRQDRLAPPALMQLDRGGNTTELARLHLGASIDVHQTAVAIVQPEICNDGGANLYYDLYLYRFSEQKLKRLTKCRRLVQISWHPDGRRLAAVQVNNAATSIVSVDADGVVGDTLWQAEDGIDIGAIDWSPDGKSIVAARHQRNRGWNIEIFDIASRSWRAVTQDEYVQAYPRFDEDGKSVLFASEASGKFQTHEIDLQSGRQRQLTTAQLGAFQFARNRASDEIFYVGYSSDGFDVFRSAQQSLAVSPGSSADIAEASPQDPPAVDFSQSDYSPWSSLKPRWWLPILGYTSESTELGILTGGNDALNNHFYALGLAYDFENEYPTGSAAYGYKDRFLLSASSINDIDLDDGDVVRIQREDSASATLIIPKYGLGGSWLPFFGLASVYESDRFTEEGFVERDNQKDNLAGLGIVYISAQQRARAISPGDGRAVKLVLESSDLGDSDYSGNIYTLDWREYLRLGASAHVIGLRYVHGWGDEEPRPFRLGGVRTSAGLLEILNGRVGPFLNNRRYTLRGYDSTSSGRRMQLATLDWRLPLANVERGVMSPPVGLLDISANLFVEGGATWNDGSEPDEYRSAAGAEVLARVNLFYALNLNLRLGYAHGYDEGGEDQVYLTLGGAF
ncbi:MAG: hypothetical protein OEU50_13650 [Gammaproteobacteria bacterium]|nr:hypothetical protein [Gammaproteobacteria bacterium]